MIKVINYNILLLSTEQRFSLYYLLLLKLEKAQWHEFPTLCVSLIQIIKVEYPLEFKDWALSDFLLGVMCQLPELAAQKPEGIVSGSYWWPLHDTDCRKDAVRQAIKYCEINLSNEKAVA